MDEKKDSIVRKKPAGEIVTSGMGGNSPGKLVRQRSLSGPGSEGEKSLLKKNPGWLVSPKVKTPVFNSCLCSLDEVVATPFFNISVIESAYDQDFKFFDAINTSKYVAYIDSAMASLSLFAVSIGIYVIKYCKLREIERNSNFFYFGRLFKACNAEEIKSKMGEISQDNPDDPITYEYLQAIAYFYPPDISKIACWRRRFFASGKERERLNSLNKFLGKDSKEETLNKLHNKITEKVYQFLNHETKLNYFQMKEYKNKWTIGLANRYERIFFNHIKHLIEENLETTRENNTKKNRNFFPPILAALGQASFIYWILMFIFYFIPIAPVITAAAISIIPLAIALCVALPLLLFFNIKNTHQTYNTSKNMKDEYIEKKHKHMLEKKLVALNKQKVFFNYFLNKDANSSIELKNSPLMKDLHAVIKNRRFSKYHAICMGFLDGCFLPLFAGWLFLDASKVILTYVLCPPTVALTSFTPIGFVATAIIAGITLLIGINYGIYSAYKANQVHEARFNDLQVKVKALQNEVPTKGVLNKPLRDYDRILRRFNDEHPLWTDVKKVLNRFVVIIKRLGTGSLVFRLVIWAPIYAAVAASTAVPAFFPIILIAGTTIGALVIMSWYLYAYNLESKVTQAGRIVEHLVQTEQLDCINKNLQQKLSEEGLDIQESNTEEKLLIFKKKTFQEEVSDAANSNSDEHKAVTTQAKSIQRDNSDPNSHGKLFKTIMNRNNDTEENMEVCLGCVAI
jgi:hypothetical protein